MTDGPYAETAEQLTGFYIIDTDDVDDLIETCKVLGRGEGVIEIRAYGGCRHVKSLEPHSFRLPDVGARADVRRRWSGTPTGLRLPALVHGSHAHLHVVLARCRA